MLQDTGGGAGGAAVEFPCLTEERSSGQECAARVRAKKRTLSEAQCGDHNTPADMLKFLPGATLPHHPSLVRGILSNGLEYAILPNRQPPGRFEAHLECKVGSIHEEEGERGMAHMLEHAVFLGTEKHETSEALMKSMTAFGMSFGHDSNAYTDFRQTVYTFHAPTSVSETASSADTGSSSSSSNSISSEGSSSKVRKLQDGTGAVITQSESNMRSILDLLFQICFRPRLSGDSLATEREAVLSELQMRNTIDYRVEVRSYQQLHAENILPERFPIGLEECIRSWTWEDIRRFHSKWYYPGNMCLYIVGDVLPEEVIPEIEQVFGGEPPGPRLSVGQECPEITHNCFQSPPEDTVIFQNPQLAQFALSFTIKHPMEPTRTWGDALEDVCDTIIGLAMEDRIATLQRSLEDVPFAAIEWEYDNSHRENCCFNTIYVISMLEDWKSALTHCVREILRLQRYGLTQGEFDLALASLLKMSSRDAEQDDFLPSENLLQSLMDSTNCKDVFVSKKQHFEIVSEIASQVTLEGVNVRAKKVLAHILNYCAHKTKKVVEEAEEYGGSIFVCAPTHMKDTSCGHNRKSGVGSLPSVGPGSSLGSLFSLAPVVDPLSQELDELSGSGGLRSHGESSDLSGGSMLMCEEEAGCKGEMEEVVSMRRADVEEVEEDVQEEEEGEVDVDDEEPRTPLGDTFHFLSRSATLVREISEEEAAKRLVPVTITEEDIIQVISDAMENISPPVDIRFPKTLMTPEEMHVLEEQATSSSSGFLPMKPFLFSVELETCEDPNALVVLDKETGIWRCRLANGIRVNYKRTPFEPKQCSLFVLLPGGRMVEHQLDVSIGMSVLADSGAGGYSPEVINRFCSFHDIEVEVQTTSESVSINFDFSVTNDGMVHAMQLLHLFFSKPALNAHSLARVKKDHVFNYEEMIKSVPSSTYSRFKEDMFSKDGRFRAHGTEVINQINLVHCAQGVQRIMCNDVMEITLIGDLDEGLVQKYILQYLGTLNPQSCFEALLAKTVEESSESSPPSVPQHIPSARELLVRALPLPLRPYKPSLQESDSKEFVLRRLVVPDDQTKACMYLGYPLINRKGSSSIVSVAEDAARLDPTLLVMKLSIIDEIVNNKIFRELREKRGMCYSVSFSMRFSAFMSDGWALANITPFPDRLEETAQALHECLYDIIARGNFTQEDFEEVRYPAASKILSAMMTNSFWGSSVRSLQLTEIYGKNIRHIQEIPTFFQGITFEEIQRLREIYLKPFFVRPVVAWAGINGDPNEPEPREMETCVIHPVGE